jgi:hypothetical protein
VLTNYFGKGMLGECAENDEAPAFVPPLGDYGVASEARITNSEGMGNPNDEKMYLGSARVSRAGFGVPPKQSFGRFAMAGRHRQARETPALPRESFPLYYWSFVIAAEAGSVQKKAPAIAGAFKIETDLNH